MKAVKKKNTVASKIAKSTKPSEGLNSYQLAMGFFQQEATRLYANTQAVCMLAQAE